MKFNCHIVSLLIRKREGVSKILKQISNIFIQNLQLYLGTLFLTEAFMLSDLVGMIMYWWHKMYPAVWVTVLKWFTPWGINGPGNEYSDCCKNLRLKWEIWPKPPCPRFWFQQCSLFLNCLNFSRLLSKSSYQKKYLHLKRIILDIIFWFYIKTKVLVFVQY
jgi:hypothetical protein